MTNEEELKLIQEEIDTLSSERETAIKGIEQIGERVDMLYKEKYRHQEFVDQIKPQLQKAYARKMILKRNIEEANE